MLVFIECVFNNNSKIPTLVLPSLLLASTCDCIPINASDNLSATLHCISGGKKDINLFIV